MSKTIVFFGNEKLATGVTNVQPVILRAIEAAGFTIEQHVTGPLSELRPHQAQLAVLAAYGHIVPQRILEEFPLGVVNVHPSLLPAYRGSTPIEQAILDGINETGVSIMRLTTNMDEGPLYKQERLPLTGNESKQELTEKLQHLGSQLLVSVLPMIADGSLQPIAQDGEPSYTRRLTKADGKLDFTKSAIRLEREIRAYLGWPKSATMLADRAVIITKAKLSPYKWRPTSGNIMPMNNRLFIGTGEGWLEILSLQPVGKKEMPVQAFLAGYGDKL
jgi:methionyl-tRNA formyltransferase